MLFEIRVKDEMCSIALLMLKIILRHLLYIFYTTGAAQNQTSQTYLQTLDLDQIEYVWVPIKIRLYSFNTAFFQKRDNEYKVLWYIIFIQFIYS